jgi:hypothetical protein
VADTYQHEMDESQHRALLELDCPINTKTQSFPLFEIAASPPPMLFACLKPVVVHLLVSSSRRLLFGVCAERSDGIMTMQSNQYFLVISNSPFGTHHFINRSKNSKPDNPTS